MTTSAQKLHVGWQKKKKEKMRGVEGETSPHRKLTVRKNQNK